MEKTRKLFAYLVVFAAIICLFAGVAIQGNLANAAGSPTASPEIKIDKICGIYGEELAEGDVVLNILSDIEKDTLMNEVENGQIPDDVKRSLTNIAQRAAQQLQLNPEIAAVADYQAMIYGAPRKIEMSGAAENGAVVSFVFSKGYTGPKGFILFKGKGEDSKWKVIEPEVAASAAANAAGNDSVSFKIPGSGIVMFGSFSPEEAAKIYAAIEAQEKDACCKCCVKGCPFCTFLCKDGKCYCWTMYVAIALVAILVALVIALVIVKSRAKKAAAAKKEEVAAAETEGVDAAETEGVDAVETAEQKEETKKEEK